MATDRHDDDREHPCLEYPHPEFPFIEHETHIVEIHGPADSELRVGDQPAAENADQVGVHRQHRAHHHHGEQTRRHQKTHRIDRHHFQRRKLLRHLHRSEQCRHAGAHARCENQRGHERSHLAEHRLRHQKAHTHFLPVGFQNQSRLKRKNHAGKERNHGRDTETFDAAEHHLPVDFLSVAPECREKQKGKQDHLHAAADAHQILNDLFSKYKNRFIHSCPLCIYHPYPGKITPLQRKIKAVKQPEARNPRLISDIDKSGENIIFGFSGVRTILRIERPHGKTAAVHGPVSF